MKHILVNFTLLSPRSIGGTKKKKSWVSNALNPTYRWAWVTPWILTQENCSIIFFLPLLEIFLPCWSDLAVMTSVETSLVCHPTKPWSSTTLVLSKKTSWYVNSGFLDTPHQHYLQVHGRLYVTTNFLCFYANIFRWETAVTIRWREVGYQLRIKKHINALYIWF